MPITSATRFSAHAACGATTAADNPRHSAMAPRTILFIDHLSQPRAVAARANRVANEAMKFPRAQTTISGAAEQSPGSVSFVSGCHACRVTKQLPALRFCAEQRSSRVLARASVQSEYRFFGV